jgi:hypothetical protein
MGEYNIVKEKSFQFALDIIKLYQYLTKEKKEFIAKLHPVKSIILKKL